MGRSWPGTPNRRCAWRRCGAARARSWTARARAGGRSRAPHAVARARSRSPPARRTTERALTAASPPARAGMVACRPPSGTSVPPRLATPQPQPRRPHSSTPPRSTPRTDGDAHAAQQRADRARARRLARTDPNAASEQSSQPPLSRCCDDHLNPGAIGRVCVVADRGMISAPTIAALDERGLEYVLGARERTDSLVRTVVLADQRPFTPLCIPRAGGAETQLFVKEVQAEGRRYIVCRNEAEAAKDAADRQAIVAALDQQLKRGDKALIGNSAYRRYLRATSKKAFEIDPGKLADEARYDGVFVLRTNARITPLQAVLRYRDLIQVEQLFRTAKALMRTRPIYHSSDAAIRGHVFCSLLALVLRKELDERCGKVGLRPEWGDVLRDLDRLQHATIESAGKTWTVRTQADGCAAALLQATGIALPPRIQATPPPQTGTEPPAPPKRRGRPRRSATRT